MSFYDPFMIIEKTEGPMAEDDFWIRIERWFYGRLYGYEGLSEYMISHLLEKPTLSEAEFVLYNIEEIKYKEQIYTGVRSKSFLQGGGQLITLERLFKNFFGQTIVEYENRLRFLINQVERITGLREFGVYLNKLLTIDAFFLNEDRHTHNAAVLMNGRGEFAYCPMFDNGAGLLADTRMDYPLQEDVYKLMKQSRKKM